MLVINQICHCYKSGFELNIQKLNIEKNSIIGLVGENGCGKTTLMSILSGYLKPSIAYDIYYKKEPKTLFIPSDMKLYDFLTVRELLRLVKKYSTTDFDLEEILERLELQDKAECQIDELSMGMQKKLTLLPLLINYYDLAILDEPFNSIDINYIYKLKHLLLERKSNSSIIISSHILDTLTDICDYFVVMDAGRIVKTFKNSGNIREIEGELFERDN